MQCSQSNPFPTHLILCGDREEAVSPSMSAERGGVGGETATVSVAKHCSVHTLKFDHIVTLAEMSAYHNVNMVKRLIKNNQAANN